MFVCVCVCVCVRVHVCSVRQIRKFASRLITKFRMCSKTQPFLKSALTWSVLTEVFLCLKANIVPDLLQWGLKLQLTFFKIFFYLL